MQKGTRYARAMHDRTMVQTPDAYDSRLVTRDKSVAVCLVDVIDVHG